LISISNYAIDNDKKYDVAKNILSKYNDNYLLKSLSLLIVFKDNIKYNTIFIEKLKNRINQIYDNGFKNNDFSIPINIIKDNIKLLKELNEGSIDEVNLCNFIISIYKNIVDISYHLFINQKDSAVICQKFLSRHNDLMKELSNDYSFFGSGLEMIDMLRKNYVKLDDLDNDELKDNINEIIDDKFLRLFENIPSIYKNIELKKLYNDEIKKNIDELKIKITENNINFYNLLNYIINCMNIVENVLIITYSNSNLIKLQLIYKSLYQYLIEINDLITILSEKKTEKKIIESFSSNCSCKLSKIVLFLFFCFIIYIILKKYKCIK
jgi:hypothetical protein